ncbi:MAG: hypothetical protein GX671_07960 [Clostridiales bacterium]|nr:hypothetical protein [Clostridiales bacterium]
MKVYISVDIEGITGVTSWNETEMGDEEHKLAAAQMKKEALAACEGAVAAGADEIWVKDAHDSGRNLWIDEFPPQVHLVRGWMDNPDSMVGGVDEPFDAALCIGYHSYGGSGENPLSHTMTSSGIFWTKFNGEFMSELLYHTYVCVRYGVPMVFVSGDKGLCENSANLVPGIRTVATKRGVGGATVNRNPDEVCKDIRETVKEALLSKHELIDTKGPFALDICYRQHQDAKRAGYYPGAELLDPYTVRFKYDKLDDVITAFFLMH